MAEIERPELSIGVDKVCWVIFKAREFDAKDAATDEASGSNATDDNNLDVLEDHGDDPVADEIRGLIDGMTDDERVDLVALMWLGRDDDFDLADWGELREEAARHLGESTADYLLGTPLLGDHLENGLARMDLSCVDED